MVTAPLLSATNLGKSFGNKVLFEGISFSVGEEERIGLIGPNGSGKSTLLRMLAGLEDPDRGEVRPRRDLRATYVAQEDIFDETHTVEEVLAASLIADGYDEHEVAGKVSRAIGSAGFADRDMLVSKLSGGWRKRLAIMRGLIKEPELLLLDEPTNHLDIDGVLWLEDLLSNSRVPFVFVSHDRYFIEHLAKRVVEINRRYPTGYFSTEGNYGDFLEARELYLSGLRQTQQSLENRARREVAWLRQGAKARTTKSKHRSEEAHKLVGEVKKFALDERRVSLEFAASNRKTKELITVEEISKAYGEKKLFSKVSLVLSPGSRLGIVGQNGSGKSTFIKTLLKQIEPDNGTVTHAPTLRVAFFDQARKQLDPTVTLKKALCPDGDGVVFNGSPLHVTSWARRFLFSTDQLSTPVGELSGGEQARVLLAKIMIEQADILLFDEPTNDLDIGTLEVLEESFDEFPGAIVLVTHDRYLLDRVSTMVLGLAQGETEIFGDYAQWELFRAEALLAQKREEKKKSGGEKRPGSSTPKKLSFKDQRELDGMEETILNAEGEVERLQAQMLSPEMATNAAGLHECCAKLEEQRGVVETLYARWAELTKKSEGVGK